MTQPPVQLGPKKRVKIFTIHGTFDHAAPWDNWDERDSADKPTKQRHFINRLGERLAEHNITLEKTDHTEFNWSGGNSHDERRIAAIALKRKMEDDLSASRELHGRQYYDGGVFVIGHSHGGTVARLAMNLWDKNHDYHLPNDVTEHDKELEEDDMCPVCTQTRNAKFDPNVVPKPNGIITFGSPFIHFEKRKGGLLAAKILVWVVRLLALIPLAAFYMMVNRADAGKLFQSFNTPYIGDVITLLLPLVIFWLIAVYLPRSMLLKLKQDPEKDKLLLATSAISWIVFVAGAVALPVYFAAYYLGGWPKIVEWMPILGNTTFWYLIPLILYALITVILPSRLISWISRKVEGLRAKLPKKYDPSEDKASPTTYLCYRTPGDEAGMHLRIFGFITWLIQTLTLAASVVLAFGLGLLLLLAIEGLLSVGDMSLFGALGISPFEQPQNFILLMKTLTYYPVVVWNGLFGWLPGTEMVYIGTLENPETLAGTIPLALGLSVALIFIGLMPSILLAIAVAYVVAMWLRGSGLVFGGEKFSWTLANKISANQRASANANVRTVFITPEAWWNMEVAHCFFYKSEHVIKDVANSIANWKDVAPNRDLPFLSMIARVAQWMVVTLFVLGIFSSGVSLANGMVNGTVNVFGQGTLSDTQTGASDQK